MIYVSTEQLSDAIRLFNVLNNRGIPLRNSDILKSLNLDVVISEKDKAKYALLWEEAENALGDEFDRFLGHIRTMLVKEKARTGLLQEFEEKNLQTAYQEELCVTRERQSYLPYGWTAPQAL